MSHPAFGGTNRDDYLGEPARLWAGSPDCNREQKNKKMSWTYYVTKTKK